MHAGAWAAHYRASLCNWRTALRNLEERPHEIAEKFGIYELFPGNPVVGGTCKIPGYGIEYSLAGGIAVPCSAALTVQMDMRINNVPVIEALLYDERCTDRGFLSSVSVKNDGYVVFVGEAGTSISKHFPFRVALGMEQIRTSPVSEFADVMEAHKRIRGE